VTPDVRETLLGEIRRKQPEHWRRAEKPFRKAMEDFSRYGYVLNVDTFFNGLSTVATPAGGPEEKRLYVLNCSVLSSVLNTDKLRREAGLALLEVKKTLTPVIDSSARRK
jgi:DNA-binding IclR family transcriptional regulator